MSSLNEKTGIDAPKDNKHKVGMVVSGVLCVISISVFLYLHLKNHHKNIKEPVSQIKNTRHLTRAEKDDTAAYSAAKEAMREMEATEKMGKE